MTVEVSEELEPTKKNELKGELLKKEKKSWHKRLFVLKDGIFSCLSGNFSLNL